MSNQAGGRVMLVTFQAKTGLENRFATRMQSNVSGTRSEPGNRQYEFYGSDDSPQSFMLYEEFADDAALQAHRKRPETVAHVQAIKPMLDSEPDMSMWTLALTNAKSDNGERAGVGHVTLVRFRIKADAVDTMLEAIAGDLHDMHGNIRFDLNRSVADPLDCMICARWVSRAIWEAHNAKPEFKGFAARTAAFLDQPMRRTLWKQAAA
jgi:(4S)-4-hydroxy-5-phosphonooxypentane-2,3-dione isomerase